MIQRVRVTTTLIVTLVHLFVTVSHSHLLKRSYSTSYDHEAVSTRNFTAFPGNQMELVCHPKTPLIEPLIVAGVLNSTSRLPTKLHHRPAHEEGLHSKMNLICKITKVKDEYLCKTKADNQEEDTGNTDYYEIIGLY